MDKKFEPRETQRVSNESEPVVLEIGTEADVEAFLALEQKVSGPTYRPNIKKEQFYGPNKIFYLAKVGEKTVGQVQYENQNDNIVYLNTFAIDPDFQGKGLGKEVMRQFLQKVANASKIWLVTHPDNTPAIHLYESVGFKITERKENYFGDGTPRVVMEIVNSA